MKSLIIILAILASTTFVEAQKYLTKTGKITFFSSSPLENIEAENNQAAGILDGTTGSLTFALLVKSFEFEKALMQEHFNENYMESDKFPKATFKGKIKDFILDNIEPSKKYVVTGKLTIHGVTKDVETTVSLKKSGNSILGSSKFIVKPEDYNIKIPKAVRNNIAKEIEVSVDVTLDAK